MTLPLPRPGPTNYQDEAGFELDLLWDQAADAIEATDSAVTAHVAASAPHSGHSTPASVAAAISASAETATTIGTLTAGATAKATPVDADVIGLSDSAASNGLKKLSWANLKTALQSVFATLAGTSGGQTLIGGTAASEALTLQSTAHVTKGKVFLGTLSAYDEANNRLGVGTPSPSAKIHSLATTEQLRLGYDTSNYMSTTVASDGTATLAATGGTVTLQGITSTDGPTLGSELLTTAGWTVTSGWTESPDDVFTHAAAGGTTALSHSATIASATKYHGSWTVTGRTAGSFIVAVGGQSQAANTATGSFGPTTTSTAGFTITPTTDFDGAISLTSLKAITAASKALTIGRSSAAPVYEQRCAIANSCTFLGYVSGRYNTTGTNNTAVGYAALSQSTTGGSLTAFGMAALTANTTGSSNTAAGYNALVSNTIGATNSAFGVSSLANTTSGATNSAFGVSALGSNTTGAFNNAFGSTALFNITTQSFNCALGSFAGRYQADGSTALTATTNSVYIGYSAKGFDNSDSYSIVIGASAVGLGANTTVLGTIGQTTAATIYGAGTHAVIDATTNAAVTVESLIKNVTGAGVGAAGLGPRLIFGAESSTTDSTTQADITATWTDATHATRKSRLALSAYDTAAREGLRIEGDGSVARLGFYGATAVVKPAALTTTVAAAPAGGTGTAAGAWDTSGNRDLAIATINNLKTRVDQLETKLQALGLLT